MEYSVNDAKNELRQVNNMLSLLMKKKKALQTFILEETERAKDIASPKSKAWELKHDLDFVKEYGRERTIEEIAIKMNYSTKQIQRFLKQKELENI